MKITTVLVANRGEIALRIIRACHKTGLRAVAVYSDADRNAPYVAAADVAVHIGASEAANSYLDGTKIIAAAKRTGADAVHPGYGFLAENATFAAACRNAGLVFVGPSPKNIELMGSKIVAKAAAVEANVPVVPGYYGDDQSDAVLTREAANVGTPLLIKASAGGGGRGMRLVHDLAVFANELDSARREAISAFGDDKVLLERYVGNARHIEVQILADGAGNVRHLFERDCSLQRNHQKVIEEAPAPNLAADVRENLLASAVRLTENIAYDSAGTIEYLLDDDTGAFYFLEMNTRLQVEHPVTEAVTGIDIVEWQLRTAGGEALPFAQSDITCTGWSIEARVAAEDPANGYAPEIGTINGYTEPTIDDVRIDSGVRAGSEISHYYDSMLAKVISVGRDRASAIRKLKRGLDGMEITGVGTNIGFLSDLLGTVEFTEGTHTTASIGSIYPDGWKPPQITPRQQAEAVLAMILHDQKDNTQSPWSALGSWRVTEASGRRGAAIFYLDDTQVSISGRHGEYTVEIPEHPALTASNAKITDAGLQYESDGIRRNLSVGISGTTVTLHDETGRYVVDVLTGVESMQNRTAAHAGEGNTVLAPMPGLVSEVLVNVGDKVHAGQSILVIEAMKLLQTLPAPCDGIIAEITCAAGESVDSGATLTTIEPEE